MNEKLIALSIPVFIGSIIVELFANRAHLRRNPEPARLGVGGYRFADTFCNLACGIGNQLTDPVLRVVGLTLYAFLQAHGGKLFENHETAEWLVAFVGVDARYYAFHRASHRVNFLWACHVVHHQSEEYNLSVALRQTWFGKLVDFPFYVPLALLGVRPEVFVTTYTANLLYQFFLHITFVPKLGCLEYVLNTPSQHRVHHGIDPQYIDRNYGGVLSIWDRIFGSFEPEGAPVHFGTVKPLGSFDPVWANLSGWAHIATVASRTRRLRDKIAIAFAPPEWLPPDLGGPIMVPAVSPSRQLFAPRTASGTAWYGVVALAGAGAVLVARYAFLKTLTGPAVAAALLGTAALLHWGGRALGRPQGGASS